MISSQKRYKFADTPSDNCICDLGIEDAIHFFLKCPLYNAQRTILTSNVNLILDRNNLGIPDNYVTLLLYGHSYLIPSDNRLILQATLKFIKTSKRFS